MLKAVIVDDENQSRNILAKMLHHHAREVSVVGEAASVDEAYQLICASAPNIIFLDIHMGNETGFDLLNKFPEIDFKIIFTSAFDQYAIRAFRFNAIDFLLKPIVADELSSALQKASIVTPVSTYTTSNQVTQLYSDMRSNSPVQDKICIPTSEGYQVIRLSDIVYCKASSNYTEFHLTGNTNCLSSYTLKHYDEILTQQTFFRAHRSYLINLNHVLKYKRGEGGFVVMSNEHEIELARTHKDQFLRVLNMRG